MITIGGDEVRNHLKTQVNRVFKKIKFFFFSFTLTKLC